MKGADRGGEHDNDKNTDLLTIEELTCTVLGLEYSPASSQSKIQDLKQQVRIA